ncbi:hypothetical protein NDU88_006045 [Pleurodeles waltl]|uniref:Uncharacterized protein n=1 Tax=Pleurodeles waltl TaxID=8319 RepID=A0AAV7VQ86_PLEWA|nr:hypothetical protein NDU88_006045 [Pleurodeles waltl]
MVVFILLSDPIGLICGPPDRLPEYGRLIPIKLSRRGGSSRPRLAGPSRGGTISVLVCGAPHHASSPCGTRIGPRQSSRHSPGGHQRSSTSHLQLAARSFSLIRSHSLALGSPPLCPALLVLRNSGLAQPEPSGWASLCQSQRPGRRPTGSNQGSSTPLPQQAAGSLSLTGRHSLASSTPHLCPTLLVLRNSGPAQSGPPGRLPSTGLGSLVVAPPEATRGVPRRSKQHVASASPGVTHWRPALLTSAQRCSCFVTLLQPIRGLPGQLPSTGLGGRVVAPPEVTRGVPCPSRIKQRVASALAALGLTHCHPALIFSAQRCSRFVTPSRPSLGPHAHRVQVTRIRHFSSSIRPGGLGGQPSSALSRSYPRLREDAEFYWIPPASLRRSR